MLTTTGSPTRFDPNRDNRSGMSVWVRGSRIGRAALAALALTAVASACGGSGSVSARPRAGADVIARAGAASVSLPATAAGMQAKWVLAAASHLPIPAATIRAHFDSAFLAQISPSALNAALASLGSLLPGSGQIVVTSISVNEPQALVAAVGRAGGAPTLTVTLTVDAKGLISGLLFKPLVTGATTWSKIDAALAAAAPESRLLVARLTQQGCQTIHAVDPTAVAPLGSMFKLYVLDALGRAIAAHKVSWSQLMTITQALKSLPSGVLQNDADGTRVSVQAATDKLISVSDNTAADLLVNLLGRSAVEQAVQTSGTADPARDQPFLTPRELFILKLVDWPALAKRYLAASTAGRRALLATVDRDPLPALSAAASWTAPRDIDGLEWFASAQDVCRLYASLWQLSRQPGLAPLAQALEINDGGLGLDPATWRTIWFKGGSEPGVLTLSYLATTRSGATYVVVALTENPSKPIDESAATAGLLAAIKGAFTLAAGG
jgi:beta-lactamase class A